MGVQGPAESVARGLGARLEGLRRAGPLERVQTQGSDDRTQEVPGLGLTVPEGAVELEGAGVRRPVQEQEPQAGTPTGARGGAVWMPRGRVGRAPVPSLLVLCPPPPTPPSHPPSGPSVPSPQLQGSLHPGWCPCSPEPIPSPQEPARACAAIHRAPSRLGLPGPPVDPLCLGPGTQTLLLVMTSREAVTRQPACGVRGVCSVI